MRKTKIVCTLGPSTDGHVKELIQAGMDVARFNFSHGTHEDHLARFTELCEARDALGRPVAAMLDTKGPEIRLGTFPDEKVFLQDGAPFTLTTAEAQGSEAMAHVNYKGITDDLVPGDSVLIDDGLISLRVNDVAGPEVHCTVVHGGWVKNRKGVNLPGKHLSMPFVSPQDEADIQFAVTHGYDFIACSFVRSAGDIMAIRRILDSLKCDTIRLIAKIESREGVDNINEILAVSDGIMVARGDMGVEIDFTQIPHLQKQLIAACYSSGRPVITATQMLESMIENPRPTRAETTDIANAIYDGTSAIMLSGETAAGKYPVESVATMAAIALEAEQHIDYVKNFLADSNRGAHLNVANAVSHAACATAVNTNAVAIVTMTKSGETGRLLSKYRLGIPIVACVTTPQVYRHMALSWGVIPVLVPNANTTDELFEQALASAKACGAARDGDLVVTTAGVPVGVSGTTNMVKADIVGDALIAGVGIGAGTATGHLCIITKESQLKEKFHAGDILVISSTSNLLLPYMKQAAAVVTEEAGANSHAAIVGLALGIPVIVGAAGATGILRDGLRVAVDADRGVVHSITE